MPDKQSKNEMWIRKLKNICLQYSSQNENTAEHSQWGNAHAVQNWEGVMSRGYPFPSKSMLVQVFTYTKDISISAITARSIQNEVRYSSTLLNWRNVYLPCVYL